VANRQVEGLGQLVPIRTHPTAASVCRPWLPAAGPDRIRRADCSLYCRVYPVVTRRSTGFPCVFRNLRVCFGSLTGGTYFVTVAKLLPKTLVELSVAGG